MEVEYPLPSVSMVLGGMCASCPYKFRLCWIRSPRSQAGKCVYRGPGKGTPKAKTTASSGSFGVPHANRPVDKEKKLPWQKTFDLDYPTSNGTHGKAAAAMAACQRHGNERLRASRMKVWVFPLGSPRDQQNALQRREVLNTDYSLGTNCRNGYCSLSH